MTEETKRQIAAEYSDKNNKAADIIKKYHLGGGGHLTKIVLEQGGELRRSPRSDKPSAKRCPKCRTLIKVNGAKYCYNCGADIRSEKDLLLDKLQSLYSVIQILPQNMREEASSVLGATLHYLRRQK